MFGAAWVVAACVLCAPHALARRHAPDLREDDPARRSTRPAECLFGKQPKELGSTWFADLGPPFGVMYCIKCECIPVQKKRRVVAKVQCRNIKSECPLPTCENPVLLPGRCCKICPGETNAPDILQDSNMVVTAPEEEELSMKHFGALLTGRSSVWIRRDDMSPVEVATGAAAGRFTFRRRHLYWSVMLGEAMKKTPRALLFLDRDGRVLIEHQIKNGPGFHDEYQAATGKVCGVWRRVPREYRRALREGALHAALVWGDEGKMDSALVGRIDRYVGLSSEMFSALLEPEGGVEGAAWGGTAALTANTGAAPSLHVAVLFNGVFTPLELRDAAVRIVVLSLDRNSTIIDEVRTISKPAHDINILEVSTPVTTAELRWLSRGRVAISVRGTGGSARGIVRQRAACDVFQAPLSGEPHSSGLAWVYLDQEGSLVYNIQVEEQVTTMPKITLVDDYGKRHTQIEILDTMVGVLARPSPRMFGPLYQDQLSVHLSSDVGATFLRGRLLSRPIPDAAGGPPILFKRAISAPASTNDLVAMGWISVDNLCTLNFEVTVAGSSVDSLESGLDLYISPRDSNTGKLLGSVDGTLCEGSFIEPDSAELTRLSTGAAVMQLRDSARGEVILFAEVEQMTLPPSCISTRWDGDNEVSISDDRTVSSCYHNNHYYDDGAQWIHTDACSMCGCVHGRVRCDPVRCPPSHCSVPTIKVPGECCPICTNNASITTNLSDPTRGCYLAGQFHIAGSSWHPYLVPDGYDTCAVCTCEYTTLSVRCPRLQCPPLKCTEREAMRPDRKSCCRVCPPKNDEIKEDGAPRDQGKPKTAAEILADGGCVFPEGPLLNGKEVHPKIHSHGEHKCVTCRCKDGVVTCSRVRCPRGACSRRRRKPDSCCACRHQRRNFRPSNPTPTPPPHG